MEGELDPDDFALAEAKGMTVPQLKASMSPREIAEWKAYYVYRAAQRDLDWQTIGKLR